MLVVIATPAWSQTPVGTSQTYVGVTPPTVGAVDPAVGQAAQTPPPAVRGDLAFTGADIMQLVAIAAFVMSAGAFTVRVTSSRRLIPGRA